MDEIIKSYDLLLNGDVVYIHCVGAILTTRTEHHIATKNRIKPRHNQFTMENDYVHDGRQAEFEYNGKTHYINFPVGWYYRDNGLQFNLNAIGEKTMDVHIHELNNALKTAINKLNEYIKKEKTLNERKLSAIEFIKNNGTIANTFKIELPITPSKRTLANRIRDFFQ